MTDSKLLEKVHEDGWLKSVEKVANESNIVSVQVSTVTGDTANYLVYVSKKTSGDY